jgi:large repetitive protein
MTRIRLLSTLLFSVLTFCIAFAQSKPISIYVNNATMECTKSNPISVRVKDFKDVTNFQFSINFPTTRMRGDSVVKFNAAFPDNAYNTQTLPNGDVTFSWSGNPVSLPDNAVLFTIYLTPYYYGTNPPLPGTAAVKITNSPTPTQAYTSASIVNTYPVVTTDGLVTILDKTPPVALCPNTQFYKGLDSVLVASITGFAIDDCGSAKVTSYQMSGANNISGLGDANGKYYKLGITKVIYTVTDLAGNTAQCPFKIILVKPSDDTITVFANSKLSVCELPGVVDYPMFIANADGKNLNKMNFSLEWDKTKFDYIDLNTVHPSISTAIFNKSDVVNGHLGVSWSGSNLNPFDNMRLFNLRLKPKGIASQTAVMVMGNPVPISVASPTNPSYAIRTEAGDVFVIDLIVPVANCKDTLLYATSASGPHTVLGAVIEPKIIENCALESYKYKLEGATTLAQTNFSASQNVILNYGTTKTTFNVRDYGGNAAQCASNVKVNRLRFDLNKDSLPCSVNAKTLDLRVTDFERLKDAKFTLTWNPAMLGLATSAVVFPNTAVKNNTVITGNAAAGTLTFTWTMPAGQSLTLPANDILMSFPFTIIGNANSPVTITNQSARLLNSSENITIQVTNGSIKNYDGINPTITNCPSDVTEIVTLQGVCSKKINWNAPIIADNCGSLPASNIKLTKQMGTTFPVNTPTFSGDDFTIGQTIVTYSVTDLFANTAVCSFKVNISETVPPQIVACIPNIVKNNDPTKNGAIVTYGTATVNESCGIQSEVFSKPNNSFFTIGKQTVTYTVTDKSGNTASCNFTVTVKDNENPTFDDPIFPTTITTNTKLDTCGAFVGWAPPTAKDNHTAPNLISITSNYAPGSFFPTGKTLVTYTAKDSTGNITVRNFEVNVIDNQAPKFVNCPATLTVNVAGAACNSPYIPPVLKTKDNCIGLVDVTASNIPANNSFPIGTTKLIYIDPNNSNVKCNVDLTLQVSAKPTFSNVNDVTVTTNPNDCKGTQLAATEPTAKDACGNSNTVTVVKNPNISQFPVGTTTVTYTATDSYGNTAVTSIKVTVKDINPPSMTACPADITANADPGKSSKIVSWIPPTGKAFCSNVLTITPSKQPNTAFPIGNTVVTYTAKDGAGNTTTCTFNVEIFDTQRPKINCPPPTGINVDADPNNVCGKVVPLPALSDNSGITPIIISSNGLPANNFYPIGKTDVTIIVADEAGNKDTCSYFVIVKDIEKPTFTGVKDVTISTNSNDCTGQLTPADMPVASDGCGSTNLDIKGNLNIDKLPLGVSTLTLTATDNDGNIGKATFKVTVVDKTPPVFANCPTKISVPAEIGKNFALVPWTAPTATDNCTVTVKSTNNPNEKFTIGTKVVTYTATDGAGNTTTCTFEVEVVDQEPPNPKCKDLNVDATAGLCGKIIATLQVLPTPTDNSGKTPTIVSTSGIPANNFYPVGKTTVTFTVSDEAGNTTSCEAVVTVKDVEKPTFTNVKDVTIETVLSDCTGKLEPKDMPTASDACGSAAPTVKASIDIDKLPLGTSIVTLTATDSDGNTTTTTIKVTVADKTKPVFAACPQKIVVGTEPGKDFALVPWTAPTATDNCSVTVKSTNNPNDKFNLGTKIVTYTATDGSGNTETCTFEVEVADKENPKIKCENILIANKADECGATAVLPIATDNVAVKNIVFNPALPANNYFAVGTQTYTMTASDAAGNTKDCVLTVTVEDNDAPKSATCPKDITLTAAVGECTKTLNALPKPTFTDNCNVNDLVITSNRDSLAKPFEFKTGETAKIIFYAKDKAGKFGTCTYNVIVSGNSKPIVACPSDINITLSNAKCDTTLNWIPATATPGCQPLVGAAKADITPGSTFKVGSTPVTYSIKDQAGLEGTCSFKVDVKESGKPAFTANFPNNFDLPADPTDCAATTAWIVPTGTDNCTAPADLKIEQTSGPKSGDKLNVGKYTVAYKVTDKSGNTSEKTFTINVNDKIAPTFSVCPKDLKVDMLGNVLSDPDNFIATVTKSTDCKNVSLTFKNVNAIEKCSLPVNLTNSGTTVFATGTPTQYKYTATDAAGNTGTCAFTVTVESVTAPKVSIINNPAGSNGMICPGGDVELKADAVAGATYAWSGPNGFTANTPTVMVKNITANSAGNYTLKITKGSCISTDSSAVKVDVMPSPKAEADNYTVYTEDLLEADVFPNDNLIAGEATFTKVTENVKHGKLSLRNDGKFEYTSAPAFFAVDSFRYNVCYETCPVACSGPTLAKIKVEVKEVKIPNVLTPNGDGQNDTLIIDYPFSGKENAELLIFNEWGHVIYQVKPYTNAAAWDATHKGKSVPDGTYYYTFKISDDSPLYKGFISILR